MGGKVNRPSLLLFAMLGAFFICGVVPSDAFADYSVTFHNQTKNLRCALKHVRVDWDNTIQYGNTGYSLQVITTGQSETVTVNGEFKCKRLVTKVKCWIQSEHKWVPNYNTLPCKGGNIYMRSYTWGGVYTDSSP